MQTGLVVVEPLDSNRELVREAGEFAKGSGAKLVLLSILPEEEYDERHEARRQGSSGETTYTLEEAEDEALRLATKLGLEELKDLGIEYETVSVVGQLTKRILAAAEDFEADHIFLIGTRRSPSGKALFGDVAQSVLLNFDNGPVTVMMQDRD
ncbi:universal stress protein [Haladaptatus sp. DYSN1]|uniref:universal stress protein n=1 Tax=unclassified Haladaptatus TaxID=2622732 RepID=UPI002406FD76|nr:universal stress protein [Haladaptatus sp. DYSN1]